MKKTIAMLLVLMLVLSLAVPAFAEETGSITITGVAINEIKDGEGNVIGHETASEYVAYQMLILESYKVEEQKYNYKIAEGWTEFFAQDAVKAYFTVDQNGYVEWKAVENETPDVQKARAAAVAQLALTYAQANPGLKTFTNFVIDTDSKKTNATTGLITANVVLSDLPLGYYLVDSTAGALCGLTTTAPNASFAAKNVPPVIEKKVEEDDMAAGSTFGKENTAEIGQLINFDATITIHPGAENYVLHDTMDAGLDFVEVLSVKHQLATGGQPTDLNASYYQVIEDPADGCNFEIKFVEGFYDAVNPGDKIVILYTGKLNEKAVIGADGNKNTLWLSYGNNSETKHDTTVTRTYGFDLAKTTTDGHILDGAIFELYKKYVEVEKNGAKEMELQEQLQFVEADEEEVGTRKIKVYRLATAEEIADDGVTKVTEFEVGVARFVGLDSDTYWLFEKEAPENYNKLAAPQSFYVDPNGTMYLQFLNDKPVTNSGVQIVNKAGTILPETGGVGTLLFTLLGGGTVLGTGVVLVTKKRMSMIEE